MMGDEKMNLNGSGLIHQERMRQVTSEGWSSDHDDQHAQGELLRAAISYLKPRENGEPPMMWPFHYSWWKPTPNDRVRELVKAGALIAAEIDRLQRIKDRRPQRGDFYRNGAAATRAGNRLRLILCDTPDGRIVYQRPDGGVSATSVEAIKLHWVYMPGVTSFDDGE